MDEDLKNIQYAQIPDYDFRRWIRERRFNGNTLNDAERKDYVKMMDEVIAQHVEGLPMLEKAIKEGKTKNDDFHRIQSIIASMDLFVIMTMVDCMVLSKHYLLANNDYERSLMRGRLQVLANEGFKKLYGYNDENHKKSEWVKLQPILERFPEIIHRQYAQLSTLLEEQSKIDSWWKNERNFETHLEAERLYASRKEELIESKVMSESMRLYDALYAVSLFLMNAYGCVLNVLVYKYKKGELTQE